jgi:hypothetical protein
MFFKKLTLEKFSEGLKTAWGTDLVTLLLHGSSVGGDKAAGKSGYDTIVILRDDAPAILRKAQSLVRRWLRQGNPAPAIFTKEKLLASRDVFPMEYADIRDRRQVLHGEDVFALLVIDPRHLRPQLENELWGALQRLRRGYVAGEDPAALIFGSRPKLLFLFRHVLRLFGEPLPARNADVVEPLCRRLSLDQTALEGNDFDKYIAALDRIVAAVDSFK